MKHELSKNTEHALQMLDSISTRIDDSHHWIGNNSIRLDKADTLHFIKTKVKLLSYVTVRQYEDRVCVELGLSGRNTLNIDLL